MDKTALVNKQIENGRRLITALDENKFPLVGALWLYSMNIDEWKLTIVSPSVDDQGPKKTYARIQSVLQKFHKCKPSLEISLNNISVLSPNNNLYRLFRTAIKTGSGISEIRFSRNTINNVYIEDALIYRIT